MSPINEVARYWSTDLGSTHRGHFELVAEGLSHLALVIAASLAISWGLNARSIAVHRFAPSFRFRAATSDGALRLGFTHLGRELLGTVGQSVIAYLARRSNKRWALAKKAADRATYNVNGQEPGHLSGPAGRNEGVDMKKGWLVVMLAALSASAWADGEAEYKYREGIMKSAGGHMSSMVAILRGRVHFDNLAIHARGMADVAGIMPTVFPEGSRVSDTESSPEIWSDREGFDAAMDQFVAAANQMAGAAESGDMGQVGPAMQALGKSCKGCHDNYRITK